MAWSDSDAGRPPVGPLDARLVLIRLVVPRGPGTSHLCVIRWYVPRRTARWMHVHPMRAPRHVRWIHVPRSHVRRLWRRADPGKRASRQLRRRRRRGRLSFVAPHRNSTPVVVTVEGVEHESTTDEPT